MTTIGVIVGRIVEIKSHPNADRIRLARVDIGQGESHQIIFGGPPIVLIGSLVPVAPPGSRLSPGGKKIRRRRYRHEDSQGMLCSLAELGLDSNAPDEVALLRDVSPGDTLDGLTFDERNSISIYLSNLNNARLTRMRRRVEIEVMRLCHVNMKTRRKKFSSKILLSGRTLQPGERMTDISNRYRIVSSDRTLFHKAIRSATEVAGRAFQDDPMWRYIVPDGVRRASVLPAALPLDYAERYGEVWVTSPFICGIAAWLSPGDVSMTNWRLLRTGAIQRSLRLGRVAFGRFLHLEQRLEEQRGCDVVQPHWYLLLLAVDPHLQGRGIGGRLMVSVLEKAQADRCPIYLQTFHERNLAFYQRHGFRVISQTALIHGLTPCWGMIRS
ncbi:MAG: GNAT family N-acetyltransferase [Pseudonocardiaceae bacterium]